MRVFTPARFLACCICVFAIIFGTPVRAGYPDHAIRLIVPFSAGGGTDILVRVLAPKMAQYLHQSIVIDNKGGGNTLIGTELLVRSPPDGYTLIMQTNNLAVNPTLYKKLSFDTTKDLMPISLVARMPHVLVVNPGVPAKSVSEFIALAKQKPGQLHFASAGSGTTNHLAGELFETLAGINMVHVPYKSGGAILPDLLAGRVESYFAALPVVSSYIRNGMLRPIAVTMSKRFPGLPNIPTIAESGYPGYDFSSWFGLLAPAGTPQPIIDKLRDSVVHALSDPEVKKRLSEYELIGTTPQEFTAFLRGQIEQSAKIIKASGASLG